MLVYKWDSDESHLTYVNLYPIEIQFADLLWFVYNNDIIICKFSIVPKQNYWTPIHY